MQYLVEGQAISKAVGDCTCYINVAGKCELCNARGCGNNNNTCPTHCWGKACNPRHDPMIIK